MNLSSILSTALPTDPSKLETKYSTVEATPDEVEAALLKSVVVQGAAGAAAAGVAPTAVVQAAAAGAQVGSLCLRKTLVRPKLAKK